MRAAVIGRESDLALPRTPDQQGRQAQWRGCRPWAGSPNALHSLARRYPRKPHCYQATRRCEPTPNGFLRYALINMVERDKTDLDLLLDHVSGDETAFPEIVRRTSGAAWAVVLKITANEEDAADAFQETYLSAHRAAANFRGDSAVSTWIHRIAVNAALACVKKRQKNLTSELADLEDIEVQANTAPSIDLVHPSDAHLDVSRSLALLSHEQQQTIFLVDMYGYTQLDAAEILGCAEGTIKSRLSRARRSLAEDLGHLRPFTTARNVDSFRKGPQDE
jgi:RNA polymerase sigma-70 factor, ECF subfamily